MFLFWNWFSWYTCYCRYYIYTCGFLTFACISSYRKPSSGFGSWYIILTFCRRSLIIFIFSCLLLRVINNPSLIITLSDKIYNLSINDCLNTIYSYITYLKENFLLNIKELNSIKFFFTDDEIKKCLAYLTNFQYNIPQINLPTPIEMLTAINSYLYDFYKSNRISDVYEIICKNYTDTNNLSNYINVLSSFCTNFGNDTYMFLHSNQNYLNILDTSPDWFNKFEILLNQFENIYNWLELHKSYLGVYILLLYCCISSTIVITSLLSTNAMDLQYLLNKKEIQTSIYQDDNNKDKGYINIYARDFNGNDTFIYTKGMFNIVAGFTSRNKIHTECINGEWRSGIIRSTNREDMRNTPMGPVVRHLVIPKAWDAIRETTDLRTNGIPLVRSDRSIFVQYEGSRTVDR